MNYIRKQILKKIILIIFYFDNVSKTTYNKFFKNGEFMKTTVTMIALFAAVTLAACGKKEEAATAEPTPVVAPAPATSSAPAASEPAKTDEAKK